MISVTALPIETILERSTLSDTGAWISPSEGARDSAEGTRGSAHSRPPLSKRLPAATEALKLTTEAVPQKRKQRRSGSIIPLHLTPMIRHQRFEFIGHNSPGLQLRSARFAGTEKRDNQLSLFIKHLDGGDGPVFGRLLDNPGAGDMILPHVKIETRIQNVDPVPFFNDPSDRTAMYLNHSRIADKDHDGNLTVHDPLQHPACHAVGDSPGKLAFGQFEGYGPAHLVLEQKREKVMGILQLCPFTQKLIPVHFVGSPVLLPTDATVELDTTALIVMPDPIHQPQIVLQPGGVLQIDLVNSLTLLVKYLDTVQCPARILDRKGKCRSPALVK